MPTTLVSHSPHHLLTIHRRDNCFDGSAAANAIRIFALIGLDRPGLLGRRRDQTILNLSDGEIEAILDDLCSRSDHQAICLLWRPQLPDPKDDHILELAVASGISTIVTHNLKDFVKAAEFGVRAITPKQLLEEME